MSLVDKFFNLFGYQKSLSLKNPNDMAKILAMIQGVGRTSVNEISSLTYSGYFSPLLIRARTTAVLPRKIMVPSNNGFKEDTKHDQYYLLQKPNNYQSGFQFFQLLQLFRIHKGNGLAWLEGKSSYRGRPTAYHLMEPRDTELHFQSGDPFIKYSGRFPNGQKLDGTRPYHEFIHVPSDIPNPSQSAFGITWGAPLYQYSKENVGLGLAAEAMTSDFIDKNGHLSKYFKHPEKLKPADRKDLADFLAEYAPDGPRQDEIPMFDSDMELVESKMNIKDIEPDRLRKFNIEESARFHTFPALMKLGHYDNANYANAYQASIEFRDTTVIPDIQPVQEEFTHKVLRPSEARNGTKVHFETKGLLQADPEQRAKLLTALHHMGVTSNEVRKIEHMPTLGPEGDIPTTQVQNIPLDLLHKYWESIINKASQISPREAQNTIDNHIKHSKNGLPV